MRLILLIFMWGGLLMADYADPSEKQVVCNLLLKEACPKAKDESGKEYHPTKEDTRTILSIPVKISNLFTLEQ